jgi:hypothetical protein
MRTGGRRLGVALALSYLRRSIALAVLAALALAAPLPSGGEHWAGRIGRHVVAPAEARKAPMRGPAVRSSGDTFKVPAFAPLPLPTAVRTPTSGVKAPTFAPPMPRRIVRVPGEAPRTPAFKLPLGRSGWQASVKSDAKTDNGRELHDASSDGARPPVGDRNDVLPRHATDVKRGAEKPANPAGPPRKEATKE